ncbi:MAG TPA: alpha/beta hydrolase [Chitinophagaceae bacterium]|jgi:hypothetical protein|nr:alpha/beta hydrolase [Chitinophagaceae bacterium]
MHFQSTILILPGLNNSGPEHWQSLWERELGFRRVEQQDWDTPARQDWIEALDAAVLQYQPENVLLVGHSLACITIAYWAKTYRREIKGALLVAPSDTEAASYPPGTTGFSPVPLDPLPFPSITVTSTDDYYVRPERARLFAQSWGSTLVEIGACGHINAASGLGRWDQGLALLQQLDRIPQDQ